MCKKEFKKVIQANKRSLVKGVEDKSYCKLSLFLEGNRDNNGDRSLLWVCDDAVC